MEAACDRENQFDWSGFGDIKCQYIYIKFILEFAGANLVGEGASITRLIKVKNSLIRISIKFIKI